MPRIRDFRTGKVTYVPFEEMVDSMSSPTNRSDFMKDFCGLSELEHIYHERYGHDVAPVTETLQVNEQVIPGMIRGLIEEVGSELRKGSQIYISCDSELYDPDIEDTCGLTVHYTHRRHYINNSRCCMCAVYAKDLIVLDEKVETAILEDDKSRKVVIIILGTSDEIDQLMDNIKPECIHEEPIVGFVRNTVNQNKLHLMDCIDYANWKFNRRRFRRKYMKTDRLMLHYHKYLKKFKLLDNYVSSTEVTMCDKTHSTTHADSNLDTDDASDASFVTTT